MALLLLLSLAWTAAVVDLAIETADADGTRLVAGGTDLVTGLDAGLPLLIVAAAAASAGLLLAWTVGRIARRRKHRRLTALSEEVSQREAGLESRRQMIESRLDELQRNHDELLGRRDDLLTVVEQLRTREEELERRIHERHQELADARRALEGALHPPPERAPDDVVIVPDTSDETSPA